MTNFDSKGRRFITALDPMDELVHRWWLSPNNRGFSDCGHCRTFATPITDPMLQVDCVECLAAGDDPSPMTMLGLHVAEQQDFLENEMREVLKGVIGQKTGQVDREALRRQMTEALRKFAGGNRLIGDVDVEIVDDEKVVVTTPVGKMYADLAKATDVPLEVLGIDGLKNNEEDL